MHKRTTEPADAMSAVLEAEVYPNPLNPEAVLRYTLPQAGRVVLTVYDVIGREIATLVNRDQDAGPHEVQISAQDLAGGVYVYRVRAGSRQISGHFLVVK